MSWEAKLRELEELLAKDSQPPKGGSVGEDEVIHKPLSRRPSVSHAPRPAPAPEAAAPPPPAPLPPAQQPVPAKETPRVEFPAVPVAAAPPAVAAAPPPPPPPAAPQTSVTSLKDAISSSLVTSLGLGEGAGSVSSRRASAGGAAPRSPTVSVSRQPSASALELLNAVQLPVPPKDEEIVEDATTSVAEGTAPSPAPAVAAEAATAAAPPALAPPATPAAGAIGGERITEAVAQVMANAIARAISKVDQHKAEVDKLRSTTAAQARLLLTLQQAATLQGLRLDETLDETSQHLLRAVLASEGSSGSAGESSSTPGSGETAASSSTHPPTPAFAGAGGAAAAAAAASREAEPEGDASDGPLPSVRDLANESLVHALEHEEDGTDSEEGSAKALAPAQPAPAPAPAPAAAAATPATLSSHLGTRALALLQATGWSAALPSSLAAGTPAAGSNGALIAFPFSDSMIAAVALAHAGQPDALCGEALDIAGTARSLRREVLALKAETEALTGAVAAAQAQGAAASTWRAAAVRLYAQVVSLGGVPDVEPGLAPELAAHTPTPGTGRGGVRRSPRSRPTGVSPGPSARRTAAAAAASPGMSPIAHVAPGSDTKAPPAGSIGEASGPISRIPRRRIGGGGFANTSVRASPSPRRSPRAAPAFGDVDSEGAALLETARSGDFSRGEASPLPSPGAGRGGQQRRDDGEEDGEGDSGSARATARRTLVRKAAPAGVETSRAASRGPASASAAGAGFGRGVSGAPTQLKRGNGLGAGAATLKGKLSTGMSDELKAAIMGRGGGAGGGRGRSMSAVPATRTRSRALDSSLTRGEGGAATTTQHPVSALNRTIDAAGIGVGRPQGKRFARNGALIADGSGGALDDASVGATGGGRGRSVSATRPRASSTTRARSTSTGAGAERRRESVDSATGAGAGGGMRSRLTGGAAGAASGAAAAAPGTAAAAAAIRAKDATLPLLRSRLLGQRAALGAQAAEPLAAPHQPHAAPVPPGPAPAPAATAATPFSPTGALLSRGPEAYIEAVLEGARRRSSVDSLGSGLEGLEGDDGMGGGGGGHDPTDAARARIRAYRAQKNVGAPPVFARALLAKTKAPGPAVATAPEPVPEAPPLPTEFTITLPTPAPPAEFTIRVPVKPEPAPQPRAAPELPADLQAALTRVGLAAAAAAPPRPPPVPANHAPLVFADDADGPAFGVTVLGPRGGASRIVDPAGAAALRVAAVTTRVVRPMPTLDDMAAAVAASSGAH